MKKILYVDMDGVLVDFQSAQDTLDEQTRTEFDGEHIHFGTERFPDWAVVEYLDNKTNI